MRIAIMGATGFLGRYIVAQLAERGHELRCWRRAQSGRSGFDAIATQIEWVEGVDSLAASQSQRHYAYAEASIKEPTAVELAEFEADAESVVKGEEADGEELVSEP